MSPTPKIQSLASALAASSCGSRAFADTIQVKWWVGVGVSSMAVCPQEEGEGQTQEPDAGLKEWGSQAGRVPGGTWDVPPEGPGHPWG